MPTLPDRFTTLAELMPHYEAYILDLWGVIHDGTALYPGVLDVLENLRARDARIVFLSNAPRRAGRVIEVLDALGVDRALYDAAISSGEAAFEVLSALPALSYYFLGPERDAGLLDGTAHRRVARIMDADILVAVGLEDDTHPLEHYDALLDDAASRSVPMHCVNPDLVVVKQTGERLWCAGILARRYEARGGVVRWYGKPHPEVYALAFAALGNPPKPSILAVGDGPETDILGANAVGIDAALVTGGILKVELKDAAFDAVRIADVCQAHGARPSALLARFG